MYVFISVVQTFQRPLIVAFRELIIGNKFKCKLIDTEFVTKDLYEQYIITN